METTVMCPFCGEETAISVDEEGGRQRFVQDCDVCCHPMEVVARVSADGEVEVDVQRD